MTDCARMSAISPPDTVPAAAAARATRSSVSPVPSLTRLSPSRIVTTRLGIATRRASAATATAGAMVIEAALLHLVIRRRLGIAMFIASAALPVRSAFSAEAG